jgi:tRNA (guanine-N7-)-methyltransferase
VRRVRRVPLEELEPYLLAAPEAPGYYDWPQVFHNNHPVEIEVGFGKGLFLVTTATARPAVNFVGIEVVRKYQLFTASRIAKRTLGNVRLAFADARVFLPDRVAAESCQAVHVYFPDPWWKQRHQKRRVFTADFAVQCQRVLAKGGRLHLATDVAEYFAVMTELVSRHTHLVSLPPLEDKSPVHDMDYLTNFERKSLKLGHPVYRAIYEK